ncbi:MAG: hypothetical protein AB7P76_06255 [Candidatus Melainabacteria bacterium]
MNPSMPITDAFWEMADQDQKAFSGEDGQSMAVNRLDLEKMIAMGLGSLPVDAIALPEHSPLIGPTVHQGQTTHQLTGQLSQYFPTAFVVALYEIQSALTKQNVQAYVIGGITRDLIMDPERRLILADVDITVEGDAIAFADWLVQHSKNFELVEAFPDFGTVTLTYKDFLMLDLASTRREVYAACGALPDVVARGVPLAEDVIRRDFTLNALAFSINELGTILDFSEGMNDIANRIIRVLHPVSFFEDPSRILRALKFAARFDYTLSPGTQLLMERFFEYAAPFYKGGGDRIKYELKSFLSLEDVSSKTQRMRYFVDHNALRLIRMAMGPEEARQRSTRLQEVSRLVGTVQQAFHHWADDEFVFQIYLCFLFEDEENLDEDATAHRLGLTRPERDIIERFQRLRESGELMRLNEFSSAVDIYHLFQRKPVPAIAAAIIVSILHPSENEAMSARERLALVASAYKTYRDQWAEAAVTLDGNDLIEMGVPEGPDVGRHLRELLDARLMNRITDRMGEVRFVQSRLSGESFEALMRQGRQPAKTGAEEHDEE